MKDQPVYLLTFSVWEQELGSFHKYCNKPKTINYFSVLETTFDFKCCTYFPVVNVGTKIFASPSVPGVIYDVDLYKSWFNFTEIKKWFCIAGKLASFLIHTTCHKFSIVCTFLFLLF